MASTLLTLWLLVSSSVQLGTLWIMKTSITPMLDAMPYDRYVNTCQLIDMHVFHPIALWNGVISAGIGVVLGVLSPTPAGTVTFVLGSVMMLGVGLTSEGVNRPIWRQIEMWSPRTVAGRWAEKRRIWSVGHDVRTFAAFGATAAYIAAAVLTTL